MNDEPIKKLVSHSVEARKINEIIDFISIEFKRRDDALSKIAERYKSIPDSYVAKLARAARGGDCAIYLRTSLEGLEEIEPLTFDGLVSQDLITAVRDDKLNEMIERVNLLIRLKEADIASRWFTCLSPSSCHGETYR